MNLKKKICKSCGTEQYIFSKGRCKSCATKEDFKPLARTPIIQKKYTISKQTQKNKEYRKSQSAIRDEFFIYHIPLCKYSEEDGSRIYEATRANICHLFYKRVYKSVQANVNNFVYLTLDQHTRFDQLLDKNDFKALEREFKCWNIVVQRMKNLLPEVKEMGKMRMLFEEYLLTID